MEYRSTILNSHVRVTAGDAAQPGLVRLAIAVVVAVEFCASLCQAQQRTFVSGLGFDTNPCSRTQPCRTFGKAISLTNAGGEVVVLDSAGYGPFSITSSVSVIAPPGVYAGISVFSGDGIDIGGASPIVILRGLTINNQGSSGIGILSNATGGGVVHIESCIVNGFSTGSGGGISFSGAGMGKMEVKDSIIRGNGVGITVTHGVALIDHTRLEGNSIAGVVAFDQSTVTVRESLAANGGSGFQAVSITSAPVDFEIESSVASNNNVGVRTQSTGTGVVTVRVSNSTITDNGTGLLNAGSPAVLLSRDNNTVEGNGTNTSGTIGSYTAK